MVNRLRLLLLDSVSGTPLVALRPDFGLNFEVIDAWGFHDDTIDAQTFFNYTDGNINIQKGLSTVASTVRKPISAHVTADGPSLTAPLVISHDIYIWFGAVSITSGKIVKLRALVREFDGGPK